MNELTLSTALETALNRIEDMLAGDDGQAFKEARKFLPVGRAALAAQPGAVPEALHRQIVQALAGLLEQVEKFTSKHGEADFETAEALRAVEAAVSHEAAPTEAKPAQDAVDADDPLQGAVDWLLQADGEFFCVATVQRTLRIGYNRANRLSEVAKERAAISAKKVQP